MIATMLRTMRTWRTVIVRSSRRQPLRQTSIGCGSNAKRPFRLLTGRVRADRRADLDAAGVDGEAPAADLDREPVETARGGAGLLLADPVVLRTVTRALDPLRVLAPRHAAPDVNAPLIERDVALLHTGERERVVDLLRLGEILRRVLHDVRARF